MTNYIDGFVFPMQKEHLAEYQEAAKKIAEIWKEHGALSYFEFVGVDMKMEGIPSFPELLNTSVDDVIIFGWISFVSRVERDKSHKLVAADPRMSLLVSPLIQPTRMIFDASRMVFGGFQSLV